MHEVKPEAMLFAHDGLSCVDNVWKIYAGYRRCYSEKDGPEGADWHDNHPAHKKFISRMLKAEYPHESPLEHATLSWHITCSRACSHQLVRHRIASYSQQSQRYVKLDDLPVIIAPSLVDKPEKLERFVRLMQLIESEYKANIEDDVAAEDARFILPGCVATQLIVTMNFRTLLHFFNERCCNRAQWEIRGIAQQMLEVCKAIYPAVFENAGPKCLKLGHCPESKPCGARPWQA